MQTNGNFLHHYSLLAVLSIKAMADIENGIYGN